MKKLISLVLLCCTLLQLQAASGGQLHENDYKWMQFNLMKGVNNKIPFGAQDDTYFEMEFGGKSGIFDLYGYIDLFDAENSSNSDRHDTADSKQDNFFFKFAPRMSINALLEKDLKYGPIEEFYVSALVEVGDKELYTMFIGLGTDINVPFLGKIGFNTYARYNKENYGHSEAEGTFDGYRISTNWFKPFYTFSDKSFISYQGYIDYDFEMNKLTKGSDGIGRVPESLGFFNGIYWHNNRYSVGYGLKYYNNFVGFKDGGKGGETSGFGHYFAVTYKY